MIFILGCQNENLLISRLVFGLLNVIYHICIWTFRTLVSDLTLDKNIASLKFKCRNNFDPYREREVTGNSDRRSLTVDTLNITENRMPDHLKRN